MWIGSRRLEDIKEEIGMNKRLTERVIRGRMRWAGDVVHMDEEQLPKIAMSHVDVGKRGRGRPRLRWKDCVERNVKRTGGDGGWRVMDTYIGRSRALVNVAAVS